MNEAELKSILDKATEKVLRGIQNAQADRFVAEHEPAGTPGTVVLVPSVVPLKERAFAQILEGYGKDLVFVAFDAGFSAEGMHVLYADTANRDEILSILAGANNVILLAPTLSLIGKITEGSDEGFPEYLFLRARLWEKNASMFLDFELPPYKRGRFGDMVSDRLDALQHLGIPCVCYRTQNVVREMMEESETRDLITEREVMDDFKAGKSSVICRADAIITPLAREKAGDLGMEIVRQEVP